MMSRAPSTSLHPSRESYRAGLCRKSNALRVQAASKRTVEELEAINALPCTAKAYHHLDSWEITLMALENSQCAEAIKDQLLLRKIVEYVTNLFATDVRLSIPADLIGNGYGTHMRFRHGRKGEARFRRDLDHQFTYGPNGDSFAPGNVAFTKVRFVGDLFPEPTGRNVNMMPFILGDQESLPLDLQCYYPMIDACPYYKEDEGLVAFLTVQENQHVPAQTTQRRPGLHIESPGVFSDDPCSFTPGVEHPWGCGVFFGPDSYEGGIYLVSNLHNSTAVWDALVDRTVPGIVDRHGGIEHLRGLLRKPTKLKAGEMIWMTDCTPHEAIQTPEGGQRTFFRLVMPNVSHWYADHSTPNPKVPLPDHIRVIRGNKFATLKVDE